MLPGDDRRIICTKSQSHDMRIADFNYDILIAAAAAAVLVVVVEVVTTHSL